MKDSHGYIIPFKCPECGYRNYITREDTEERKEKLLVNKAKRNDSNWFGENLKETIRDIKLLFKSKP